MGLVVLVIYEKTRKIISGFLYVIELFYFFCYGCYVMDVTKLDQTALLHMIVSFLGYIFYILL